MSQQRTGNPNVEKNLAGMGPVVVEEKKLGNAYKKHSCKTVQKSP